MWPLRPRRSASSPQDNDNDISPTWREEPETTSNVFTGLLFLWIQPLFRRASLLKKKYNRGVEQEDLVPLARMDEATAIQDMFEEAYNNYVPSPRNNKKKTEEQLSKAKLNHALIVVCKQRLITAGIIKFFNTCFQFTFPLLLNEILIYFEEVPQQQNDDFKKYRGYWLSCLLLLFTSCKALSEANYFHKINRCAWRIKVAISSAVYRKSLSLAASSQQETTFGEMVNLMQIDASKVEMFVPQLHVIWDGAFQIAGYMTILGFLLGWSCVVGLLLLIVAIPIMGAIMSKLMKVNRAMVKFTDDRVKTANEAMQGIRCVKMYTWETSMARTIEESRKSELQSLRRIAYLRAFSRAYMMALPTLTAVVTFLALVYATDVKPTASTLFAAIVAFDQLRFPLLFYPMTIAGWAQAKVSLGRISDFLNMKEVKSSDNKHYVRRLEGDGKIVIENTTLYWRDPTIPMTREELLAKDNSSKLSLSERTSTHSSNNASSDGDDLTSKEEELIYARPVVQDVNLRVETGQLCAIIGRVGSGKSSLCAGILNEAVLGSESCITLQGTVAYVAQSAWILNKTVRDNILFGSPYDKERYEKVLRVCQLTHDLKLLEDGDMTEIGERGINLSGGQKQRISVARAAYSTASVIVLDDPLSALDPEVALNLFQDCIVGFLKDRTRLLVTNQLQCLPHCDMVVAFGKKGRVLEQGSYDDLMNDDDGEVRRLLSELSEAGGDDKKKTANESPNIIDEQSPTASIEINKSFDSIGTNQSQETVNDNGDNANPNKIAKSLVTTEEREVGAVKAEVYLKYLRTGGGYLKFALVFFGYIISTGGTFASSIWISFWSSDAAYQRNSQDFYIAGYGIIALLVGFFVFFRSYGMALFGVKAASTMHSNLVTSILRAPMSFFDTTPTGRILSRFSKDIHTIDHELTDYFDFVLSICLQLILVFLTIIVVTPWFGIVLVPLIILYFRIMDHFRNVSRETKRLESLTRTPVYNHFSETLGGLSTIRAYGERANFVSDFERKLDQHTRSTYNNKTAERWLSSRLDLLGAAIAGGAALFCTHLVLTNDDDVNFASYAGISLSYAISVTGMLQWVIRSFAQVESAMNSCERVFHYTEEIPQEAAMVTDEKIPPNWPEKGAITLSDLKMKYREDTPLVLKGLNVDIPGGQRIGVVGRTGSGKSSLLLALMRIVEPYMEDNGKNQHPPPLAIDGVDVMRLGLYDLRSKLGIIPQSPVLFSGTIRSNMDPFEEHTDEEIWSALEKCSMKTAVETTMNGSLQAPVAEYGENLSQGQRQLLCLGRALLKQCRILLLDEATSSVDMETDVEIQKTIRQAFPACTVLTIAHRIQTILDSDQILVMSDGMAKEFAPPDELLQDETSLFSEIVRHSQQQQ